MKKEKTLDDEYKKLAKLQRQLARKTEGSNNWKEAKLKVTKQQKRIERKRLEAKQKPKEPVVDTSTKDQLTLSQ
jgi:transposase